MTGNLDAAGAKFQQAVDRFAVGINQANDDLVEALGADTKISSLSPASQELLTTVADGIHDLRVTVEELNKNR